MSRTINHPEPGHFKLRLARNGPLLPARIWRPCHCTINGPDRHAWQATCDRWAPTLLADIAGQPCNPNRIWETSCDPITEQEYHDMIAAATEPADHAIDPLTAKPPF